MSKSGDWERRQALEQQRQLLREMGELELALRWRDFQDGMRMVDDEFQRRWGKTTEQFLQGMAILLAPANDELRQVREFDQRAGREFAGLRVIRGGKTDEKEPA